MSAAQALRDCLRADLGLAVLERRSEAAAQMRKGGAAEQAERLEAEADAIRAYGAGSA